MQVVSHTYVHCTVRYIDIFSINLLCHHLWVLGSIAWTQPAAVSQHLCGYASWFVGGRACVFVYGSGWCRGREYNIVMAYFVVSLMYVLSGIMFLQIDTL